MLYLDDIKVEFESQGFRGTHLGISPEKDKTVMFFESNRSTKSVRCPNCGGSVYIYENGQVKLKDIPLWRGTSHTCNFFIHRYKCNCCQETFTEEIPFKYPGTRITYRAANWIKGFLQQKMSIKAIQELTGIHWDTIRKVQREIMDEAIWKRETELKKEGYKPRILAIDEFAIHKGHSYATCVMNLEQGDILWVGKGRARCLYIIKTFLPLNCSKTFKLFSKIFSLLIIISEKQEISPFLSIKQKAHRRRYEYCIFRRVSTTCTEF